MAFTSPTRAPAPCPTCGTCPTCGSHTAPPVNPYLRPSDADWTFRPNTNPFVFPHTRPYDITVTSTLSTDTLQATATNGEQPA